MAHGALDQLPRNVPASYGNPGLKDELVWEKIGIISTNLLSLCKASKDFFAVDKRKAGLVSKEIATKPRQPAVLGKNDLRGRIRVKVSANERLSRSPRRVVHDDSLGFRSRVFTNSNRSWFLGSQARAGFTIPARTVAATKSHDTVRSTSSYDNPEEEVEIIEEDAAMVSDNEGASKRWKKLSSLWTKLTTDLSSRCLMKTTLWLMR